MGRRQLPHLQSNDLIHIKCGKCETGAEPAQPLSHSEPGEAVLHVGSGNQPESCPLSSCSQPGADSSVKWMCLQGLELGGAWQKRECPHLGLADLKECVSPTRSATDLRLGSSPPAHPATHPLKMWTHSRKRRAPQSREGTCSNGGSDSIARYHVLFLLFSTFFKLYLLSPSKKYCM